MTKSTNQLSFIDIENDFTEEEEEMFKVQTPFRGDVGTTATSIRGFKGKPSNYLTEALVSGTASVDAQIIKKYQEGMPVIRLVKQYGMSTATLYRILDQHNIPLRGGRNQYTNPDDVITQSMYPVEPIDLPTEALSAKLPPIENYITIRIPREELAKGGTFTIKFDLEGENN